MDYFPKQYRSGRRIQDSRGGPPLKANEITSQNIVLRLLNREMWADRRCGTEKYLERSMHQSIFPNFTITHVDKPPCFLRKFTPDGKHFVAFSSDQMSIEVYSFMGPSSAAHLFTNCVDQNDRPSWLKTSFSSRKNAAPVQVDPYQIDQIGPDDNDKDSQQIRRNIFDAYFKLKFRIGVAPPGEQLNRECSLFTENSKYMLVGSATYIQDDFPHPHFHDMYRNNESVEPNPRYPLEDYSIHLVDIREGVLTDTKNFKVDKIYLSHNQGIYLYNRTLAVLSVQHQTIHIFHIQGGKFQEIRTLGRFCYEDDELLYSNVREFQEFRPYEESFYCSLKHRLLSYIYLKSQFELEVNSDPSYYSRFIQYFEQLRKLKIWKMQLLDAEHILLKYSSEEVVTLKSSEPNSQHCLFVIYDIKKTEIKGVFENTSDRLVELFEGFTDSFRNNFLTPDARYSSSPANNIYAKQIHQRFRQTITSARFGGPVEATKRILAQLPISAQSFSASPYLDQALFSYDDHRVSVMERPKACGENPIKFYGRDSGLYKFQIHAGILSRGSSHSGRRLVAFTFHPWAPFAISVQRANAEYLVHFHVRHDISANLAI